MGNIHPRYITDADGSRVSVRLPLAGVAALREDLQDLRDALKAREEPTVLWDSTRPPAAETATVPTCPRTRSCAAAEPRASSMPRGVPGVRDGRA